jgi:hypothetical protein
MWLQFQSYLRPWISRGSSIPKTAWKLYLLFLMGKKVFSSQSRTEYIYIYIYDCIFTYNKGVHEKNLVRVTEFHNSQFQEHSFYSVWGGPCSNIIEQVHHSACQKCNFFIESEDLSEHSQNCSISLASLTQFTSSLFICLLTILKLSSLSWWLQFEQMMKFTFGHVMFS